MRTLFAMLIAGSLLPACETIKKEERKLEGQEQQIVQKADHFWQACKGEAEKICKSAGGDRNKQAACLKQNKDKVGVACRNSLNQKI